MLEMLAAGAVPALRHSQGVVVLGPFRILDDVVLVEGQERLSFTHQGFYDSLKTLRSLRE